MSKVYVESICGASGDMFLAALLDLGVPLQWLQEQLQRLAIPGLSVAIKRTRRSGLSCNQMVLSWETPREYRHAPEILDIIQSGGFSQRVNQRAELVLMRLAQAEAQAHGIAVEQVHFHEIGAIDTIIDIAGACLCLEYLEVEELLFSTLTVGHGTIETEHGVMSVPVPATMQMLKGFDVRGVDIATEILTPTGCALLTALGSQVAVVPAGTIRAIGYGCGEKDFGHHPNVLRTVLFEGSSQSSGSATEVRVVESDMDHVSGELMAFCAEACFEAGALDVSWAPLVMKKGRPGYRLTVVCTPGSEECIADIVIGQTRTLGVRVHGCERIVAQRSSGQRHFMGQSVEEKLCSYKDHSFTKLEFDALAALARESGLSIPALMERYAAAQGGECRGRGSECNCSH
jgi:uncharacterized protein (TIGR00299 family) protein